MKTVVLRWFFLCFEDSSKELEELRSAFARAVEYLKQEVEERKLNHPVYCFVLCRIIFFIRVAFHIMFNLSSGVLDILEKDEYSTYGLKFV